MWLVVRTVDHRDIPFLEISDHVLLTYTRSIRNSPDVLPEAVKTVFHSPTGTVRRSRTAGFETTIPGAGFESG